MIVSSEWSVAWQHRQVRVNGVQLHVVEAGSGPLILLLHGFPEFWFSWRHQIPALASAGFHVLAPDLRGYNLSDKPRGVSAYRIDVLREDVVGLIRQANAERAVIVGHDWGGVIAWNLAMHRPEVVEKLIVLNAPHPAAYRRELRSWSQLRRSWYVFFFQLPRLPEWMLAARDFSFLDRTLRRQPVRRDAFSGEDVHLYKQALSQPGALTAALNYYRALGNFTRRTARDEIPISVPTLLLWGQRDAFLSTRLTERLDVWVRNLTLVQFPDASHWIQNDAPERVNNLMIDFVGTSPVLRG
jgi:pimeloyl-ACP methyl ester carboxylesterase